MRCFLYLFGFCLVAGLFTAPSDAAKRGNSVRTSERIKYYSISGRTAADFAASMSKNGPYSRQHKRRAWATAARDVTYQLQTVKSRKGCRVKNANVKLIVTYTFPKLRNRSRVPKRELKKWRRMFNLLNKHERVHGRYYKEFARNVHSALRKLRPTSNCRALNRKAAAAVERLNVKDSRRNDRFDVRDKGNYRRMSRIYSGS